MNNFSFKINSLNKQTKESLGLIYTWKPFAHLCFVNDQDEAAFYSCWVLCTENVRAPRMLCTCFKFTNTPAPPVNGDFGSTNYNTDIKLVVLLTQLEQLAQAFLKNYDWWLIQLKLRWQKSLLSCYMITSCGTLSSRYEMFKLHRELDAATQIKSMGVSFS